jgi:hypothetical protein
MLVNVLLINLLIGKDIVNNQFKISLMSLVHNAQIDIYILKKSHEMRQLGIIYKYSF